MFSNFSAVISTIFPQDNQALFSKEFSWSLLFLLETVLIELFQLVLICAQRSERLESHNILHGQTCSVSWCTNFCIYVPLKYLQSVIVCSIGIQCIGICMLFIITVLCCVKQQVSKSYLVSVYRFRFGKKSSRKKSQAEEETELCPVFNIFVFFYHPNFSDNQLTQSTLCYRPLYPQRGLFYLCSS